MDARVGNLIQKCAWASSDRCTSATGIATGSVSLRVMVSGDAVMSGGDDINKKSPFQQLHKPLKPAGEDTINQAAIKVLSSAEWNPATQHFLTPRHQIWPIRRMLLKAVCPDLSYSISLLCAALYLHNLSSVYSCDLVIFLCISLHTIWHTVHFWARSYTSFSKAAELTFN